MTPLKLTQMKASCGINKLAAEHIEYLQKTIKVSAQCMKGKQERIDKQQAFIDNVIETQKKRYGDGMGLHLDMITIVRDWRNSNET